MGQLRGEPFVESSFSRSGASAPSTDGAFSSDGPLDGASSTAGAAVSSAAGWSACPSCEMRSRMAARNQVVTMPSAISRSIVSS